jgi:O-glycosyl hydrolase
MIQAVKATHPNIPMHLTERGPNLTKLDKQDVKWWADVVFGALNNGCKSYSSWNLVLDADGQPNVGKHPCGGLFTIDIEKGTFTESVQAKLFRQFSPYVERGAKILSIAQPKENIRAIAFQNPAGNYVVCLVAQNKPNKRQTLQLKYRGEYMLLSLPLNTWSMTTILIEK